LNHRQIGDKVGDARDISSGGILFVNTIEVNERERDLLSNWALVQEKGVQAKCGKKNLRGGKGPDGESQRYS